MRYNKSVKRTFIPLRFIHAAYLQRYALVPNQTRDTPKTVRLATIKPPN